MSEDERFRQCPTTGYIVVDGRRVAVVRCDGAEGHDRDCYEWPATRHGVTLEWDDDEALRADWPEAYDPDEPIDVDVPELSDDALSAIVDAQVDAHREARAFGDD